MTSELTQSINLVKSKNQKVKNICYKEVHKIEINKEDKTYKIKFLPTPYYYYFTLSAGYATQ